MSENERPLPKPPNTAFGRKNKFAEEDNQSSLLADRMAAAAAEGKLDEFLKQELPDSEYARNLASMMMGMTGMSPNLTPSASQPQPSEEGQYQETAPTKSEEQNTSEVPGDVRSAVMSGDIQGVMNLLRREQEKRHPGSPAPEEQAEARSPQQQQAPMPGLMPTIDKEIVDALVKIALENNVTLDWIILRAIRLYVMEYQKTGRL